MSSRFLRIAAALAFALAARAGETGKLRFCVEPNNMPFSNERLEGFENRLATLLAAELHTEAEFVWCAQRRGYIRNTILAGRCDVLMAIPAGTPSVLTTEPYYRSAFALLVPRGTDVSSPDDPALKKMRIGLHVVDDDYVPPGQVLAARGLQANIIGFSIYGAAGEEEPAGKLVRALDDGRIDVAVLWGPFAGYFARSRKGALRVIPVTKSVSAPRVPLSFPISLAVRPGNKDLLEKLNAAIERRSADIRAVLASYGVPEVVP